MEKLKVVNNTILNMGENDEILAVAYIIPFTNKDLMNYVDNLIKEEIKAIRCFDCGDEDITDEEILEEFSSQFEEFYSFKEKYSNMDNVVYLDLIENKGIKKGSALKILDYLKETYNGILLFSVEDAIDYWKKNGFTNVLADSYYFYN